MEKEHMVIDRIEGNPALFQRPDRENDKCGHCGINLIRSNEGRFVCHKCGFSPWVDRNSVAIKF